MKLLDEAKTHLDPLLRPFFQAPELEAQDALGRLLTLHARPIIQGILRQRLGSSPEAHDLEGEIVLRLIERLRRLRLDPGSQGILDFRGYVAVATYNALAEQVRKREPAGTPRPQKEDLLLALPDPAPDASASLLGRNHLALLWREIRRLPPRQVAALLLNLRDDRGGNAVVLLPLMGIATLREIAHILGLADGAFAELWNRLPLEDSAIAGLLGVTRQQVINLRKSARERLTRRMREH